MAYSEFLWLLDESQETKIKKTNMLRQSPSCLTGFCEQSKTQRISFPSITFGVDFQYFCYHYNKLSVISLSYEHGSGANVLTIFCRVSFFDFKRRPFI